MNHFESDYVGGALPEVLSALISTNHEETTGYGVDDYCTHAAEILQWLCQAPDAQVHFLVGGTQCNTTVIAAALRPHQGVLCAHTGHINAHETGAIEATGHKVLALPAENGKITAEQISNAWHEHFSDPSHEHIVQPGMVYLSQPTEIGTLYSLEELEAISRVCRECHMPLFIDGARLVYALSAPANDVTLPDLARLADVFYLGGTKAGLLFGEALVITNDDLKQDFRYHIKQHGGMLAKGRLLGVQFAALLEDNCYLRAGTTAIQNAFRIRDGFAAAGIPAHSDSPTNQQFFALTKAQQAALSRRNRFEFWAPLDENTDLVRFCTGTTTREEAMTELLEDIAALSQQES